MIKFISGIKTLFDSENIICSAMDELFQWLDNHHIISVDTETQGYFNFKNKVIMLQIGDFETQFVIDVRNTDIKGLASYMSDPKWLKVFQNAKFDINFLRFTAGFIVENVYDTFLAECILTNGIEGRKLSLDHIVSKYVPGVQLNKEIRNRFVELQGQPYTQSQIKYGADDVKYLQAVMDKQKEAIHELDLDNVLILENKAVSCLADMEYNGIVINPAEWLELAEKAKQSYKDYVKELDEMVMVEPKLKSFRKRFVQQDMFGGEIKKVNINWSSPLQVTLLFKKLGLPIDSSSKLELTKHQNKYPIVKKFIDYKAQEKLLKTYGADFLQFINPVTGRIHTNFWQILDTHRLSSSEPNMQQIPAKTEKDANGNKYYPYLSCFKSPPGFKFVIVDFSQQELRLIAEGSKDPLWIEIFNDESRDLHGEIASKIFNIPISQVKDVPEFVFVGTTKVYLRGKSPRDITKTINFMLAYGGSKYKLSDTLGITIDEADAIIKEYFRIVPGVHRFLTALAAYGIRNKYTRSYKPYSILRHLEGLDVTDKKQAGEIERASKNTPIQGSGAMMCKLAMVMLREKIKEMPYLVEMCMQIHDSIMCYVSDEHAEEWGSIQKEIMEMAGREFIHSIPVKSDVTISTYWKK